MTWSPISAPLPLRWAPNTSYNVLFAGLSVYFAALFLLLLLPLPNGVRVLLIFGLLGFKSIFVLNLNNFNAFSLNSYGEWSLEYKGVVRAASLIEVRVIFEWGLYLVWRSNEGMVVRYIVTKTSMDPLSWCRLRRCLWEQYAQEAQ